MNERDRERTTDFVGEGPTAPLQRRIDELEQRLADIERMLVIGPGWIPTNRETMPRFDEAAEAGKRIAARVEVADANLITRPIDAGELEGM